MNRLESGHPNEFVCRLKTLWERRTTFHFDGNVQNRPSEIGPLSKDAFLYAQTGMRLLDSRIRDRRPQILDGQPQPYLFPLLYSSTGYYAMPAFSILILKPESYCRCKHIGVYIF